MKKLLAISMVLACGSVLAQSGKDAFVRQQAMAELQRVTSQIDLLQNNYDDLAARVARLERGNREADQLRAEISSLRSQLNELKNQLHNQRAEIVKDISGKIAQMPMNQPPPKTPKTAVAEGSYLEYTVSSGDSLYIIAKAFKTTVPKLKAMNPNIKGDALRVGQKIKVPKE